MFSLLNADAPHKLAGAEPQAIEELETYSWPHNLTQFKRVIGELSVTEKGSLATAENVKKILQKEQHIGYISNSNEAFLPIDLNRPLHEIEKDIVFRVLQTSNNNQTDASRKLGISRTTLWRIVSDK